jgi:hypothetical protein
MVILISTRKVRASHRGEKREAPAADFRFLDAISEHPGQGVEGGEEKGRENSL